MGDILTKLKESMIKRTKRLSKEQFTLTSLVKIYAQFKPKPSDLPYSDVIIVAQTEGAGSCCCYCEDPEIPNNILGMDARFVQTSSLAIEIAILDAIYSSLKGEPDICCQLKGSPSQKATARASIIASEINRLMRYEHYGNCNITVVGAVENILSSLESNRSKVFATDLDSTLIGKKLGGVIVENGSMTLERVKQSHIALVTGMTLSTGTLDNIISTAKLHGTRIIMFSQTGGNFAKELINLGVDCVVSEEYPFYMFPGITTLRVYRAKDI